MIRRLLMLLILVLLAGCADGAGSTVEPMAMAPEAAAEITIEGEVADVALSARLILLAEPVDGIDVVVLEEGGKVFASNGEQIGLGELERGQTITAGGQRGSADGLLALAVFVVGVDAGPAEAGPTEAPPETPTVAATSSGPQQIALEVPRAGQTVSSPLEVRGSVARVPSGGTLRVRVYDAQGQPIGEAAVSVAGSAGQAGTFSGHVPFEAPSSGGGTVEVADVGATGGSAASAQVQVSFDGTPSIGLTGVVASLSTSPPLIALTEPVQGFGTIALSEQTRLSYLNGGVATLDDIRPGQTVWASGFRKDVETLAATQIVLIEAGGASPSPEPRTITLDGPQEGETVTSPITLRGRVSATPFEGTLVARLFDASDLVLVELPFIVDGEMGEPASFAAEIAYPASVKGPGRIEVVEISPRDGSIVTSAEVGVVFAGAPDFMIVGRVASVFPDAGIIDLVEAVEGFGRIEIDDETVILSVDGSEMPLAEIEPEMKIEVSGQPGDSGTLIATYIRVVP